MTPGPIQEETNQEVTNQEEKRDEMSDAEICVCLPLYIIGIILVIVYFTVGF